MKARTPLEKTLEEIEANIDGLSKKWDSLDSQGTQTEEQRKIADEITRLESNKVYIQSILIDRDGKK